MSDLPAPLTPADCDLQDFEFMPVMVRRLLKSETWSLGTGDERAAAVALWFESWHQVPAASLPSDDRLLKRLADSDRWPRVRAHVMRGWVLCSDQRYYHPVVSEKALESWIEKLLSAVAGAGGNAKRWKVTIDVAGMMAQLQTAIAMLRVLAPQSRTLKKKAVVKAAAGIAPGSDQDHPPASGGESGGDPQVPSGGDSGPDRNRQGQGQGQGFSSSVTPDGVTGGAGAPPADPADAKLAAMTPAERRKTLAWRGAKSLLHAHGMPMDQTGTFLGALAKGREPEAFIDVIERAVVERPAEPEAWLKAAFQRADGQRGPAAGVNRQEALEQRNRQVAHEWAQGDAHATT